MKTYNYLIEDEKLWGKFTDKYKKTNIGRNLNDAITALIRKFVEEKT